MELILDPFVASGCLPERFDREVRTEQVGAALAATFYADTPYGRDDASETLGDRPGDRFRDGRVHPQREMIPVAFPTARRYEHRATVTERFLEILESEVAQ